MTRQISLPFAILSTIFCWGFIVDGFLELKILDIFGFSATAGLLVITLIYIVNDCLVEVYGYKLARFVVWLTFLSNIIVILLLQLACNIPSPEFWDGEEHFQFIFGLAPRITIASMIAFVFGSMTNAYVMSKMKVKYEGKYFKTRAFVSTVFGEFVDSLTFFTIAFYGLIPNIEILSLIFTQACVKIMCETLILPITAKIVKMIKKYDNIDIYDKNISYNILSIKV